MITFLYKVEQLLTKNQIKCFSYSDLPYNFLYICRTMGKQAHKLLHINDGDFKVSLQQRSIQQINKSYTFSLKVQLSHNLGKKNSLSEYIEQCNKKITLNRNKILARDLLVYNTGKACKCHNSQRSKPYCPVSNTPKHIDYCQTDSDNDASCSLSYFSSQYSDRSHLRIPECTVRNTLKNVRHGTHDSGIKRQNS